MKGHHLRLKSSPRFSSVFNEVRGDGGVMSDTVAVGIRNHFFLPVRQHIGLVNSTGKKSVFIIEK